MQIVQAPDKVLTEKAKFIPSVNKNILDFIEEMKNTLLNQHDPEGVGLAAPQVGKSLQLFIVKESKNSPFSVFMNPKIIVMNQELRIKNQGKKAKDKRHRKKDNKLEGCLSLKDIWGIVKRAPKVKITYIDETGQEQKKIFDGFFATILQHEYDHLQGILFPKRVLEQKGKLYKSHKDENGEDVFEQIAI